MYFLILGTLVIYYTAMNNPEGGHLLYVQTQMIQIMLGVAIVSEWHYILNIVSEMANALEIRILCVKEKITTDAAPPK